MYKITLNDNNVSNESVYVSYKDLNSILDCSADHVSCDILQKIPFDNQIVKTILDKIKPNGIVIFTILDIPKIAKNYINNHISGSDFLNQISPLSSAVVLDDVFSALPKNVSIQQINHENNLIIITLTKLSV
jgi:hypothetical protein